MGVLQCLILGCSVLGAGAMIERAIRRISITINNVTNQIECGSVEMPKAQAGVEGDDGEQD